MSDSEFSQGLHLGSLGTPILDTRTLLRHRLCALIMSAYLEKPDNLNFLRTDKGNIVHNCLIYEYPHGNTDIILTSAGDFMEPGWEQSIKTDRKAPAPRAKGKASEGDDRTRSMRRARANVRRLALANYFKWFVTLTLDGSKVDRYDPKAIMKTVNRWLDNMVQRKGLAYILVPERHKDGAFHFHGFFTDSLTAVDSGHSDSQGHPIYNLPQWPLGFTTAIELYGEYSSAVAYVCKYIGKQEGERPMGRWYYSGGALAKPSKLYMDVDYTDMKAALSADGVALPLPGKEIFVAHIGPTPAAPEGRGARLV